MRGAIWIGAVGAVGAATTVAAGCGRLDFGSRGDAGGGDAVAGHDEDLDGLPDRSDNCPHIANPIALSSTFGLGVVDIVLRLDYFVHIHSDL